MERKMKTRNESNRIESGENFKVWRDISAARAFAFEREKNTKSIFARHEYGFGSFWPRKRARRDCRKKKLSPWMRRSVARVEWNGFHHVRPNDKSIFKRNSEQTNDNSDQMCQNIVLNWLLRWPKWARSSESIRASVIVLIFDAIFIASRWTPSASAHTNAHANRAGKRRKRYEWEGERFKINGETMKDKEEAQLFHGLRRLEYAFSPRPITNRV